MATLAEILVAVRELSFDRYPIPCFTLKAKAGKFVTNTSTHFKVLPTVGSGTPDQNLDYLVYTTNKLLTDKLIEQSFPIAFTSYYSGQDSPKDTLLRFTDAPLSTNLTMLKNFYLSDVELVNYIIYYYRIVLKLTITTVEVETAVLELNEASVRHLVLFIAIMDVDKRQLAEYSAEFFNTQFSDGTGMVAGTGFDSNNGGINVSVGSVFSISDDNSITGKHFQEDFNRVGSDNVLGNKNNFWFKLFLWLRDKLEFEYRDYYFRKENVIIGNVDLQKDINFRAYFDSYPFTLSPTTRGII